MKEYERIEKAAKKILMDKIRKRYGYLIEKINSEGTTIEEDTEEAFEFMHKYVEREYNWRVTLGGGSLLGFLTSVMLFAFWETPEAYTVVTVFAGALAMAILSKKGD